MPEKILLPALRAHMGDWIYYLTFLKMSDIAERVKIAQEIHPGKTLNELIQRRLKKRAPQIKDYLLTQPQRFFNTLVIGVYKGEPEWYELGIKDNDLFDADNLPVSIAGALGILELRGDETLFALDGQHRVEGIKIAIKQDPSLGNEEVGAIFVGHKNDQRGIERTRRLFTTLNRHAKPVSKKDSIALDEDDVVAIVTRRLADEYPLFHEKLSLAESKNLPVADNKNFTSIIALYDSLDIYLRAKPRGWNDIKKRRPPESEINKYYAKSVEFWDRLVGQFEWLQKYYEKESANGIATEFRNEDGGYLLFRPIGVLLIVKVIKSIILTGKPLDEAIQLISKIPVFLTDDPWNGLLWDPLNRRMITAPVNQFVGEKLAFYSVGGDLELRYKSNPENLKKQLAGVLNKQVDEINLPLYYS
ncbi:MAG: DGQHR domain-containing protein [Anaerolineaceae bacterium]|nr:DGQHR domain-containing protein [Anaerolineaceae bacterium]MBN2678358.1 DGQHR domain-containing protein [Anaerolineaceae bacterium]